MFATRAARLPAARRRKSPKCPSVEEWIRGMRRIHVFVCTADMKYPRLGIYKEQELRLDVVKYACKPQHSGGGGERIMVLRLAWVT